MKPDGDQPAEVYTVIDGVKGIGQLVPLDKWHIELF